MTSDDNGMQSSRQSEFARKAHLEELLASVNRDLAAAEHEALAPYHSQSLRHPLVFVMGAARCGSTLFMQWLASLGPFAYPTNVLSRFWAAPITGARIQKLLFDPAFDFRDELADLKGDTDFVSHHGKTKGALSPNEFWYFWRRFFPGNDYQPPEVLEKTVDTDLLKAELAGIVDVFDKPIAAKGMIFNENIPFMARHFPNAIFVWIRRQPEYNIQSLLFARERQYGDRSQWYSFRIRDFERLKDLPPIQSVSGQVASIHASIEQGLSSLPDEQKLTIDYEDFCRTPAITYSRLAQKLQAQGLDLPAYAGSEKFEARNEWRLAPISFGEVRDSWQHARRYITETSELEGSKENSI